MSSSQTEQLYRGITNVREDFIAEAQEEMLHGKEVKRAKKRRFLPLVACLVLVLGTVSVFAATELGLKLRENYTSSEESGYDIAVEIERKPVSRMSEEVRAVSPVIAEQFQTHEPYGSVYPGSWLQDFLSSAEAVAFIGLPELHMPELGLEEEQVTVGVEGKPNGEIQCVSLSVDYQIGQIRLQSFADVYTENSEDASIRTGILAMEKIKFTESGYTTPHGIPCLVMTGSPMASGRRCQTGYLVHQGVLYSLHASYEEEDSRQVEKLIRQWADSF